MNTAGQASSATRREPDRHERTVTRVKNRSMIKQMLMPLDRHYDDGLAATGDAFKEAAEKLIQADESRTGFLNWHLPINYLLRHAIELFLKSSIVTVHRFFKLPSGEGPHQRDPLIKINNKWKSLHKTHSVKTLLEGLQRLISDNKDRLKAYTPSSWEMPLELIAWIETIEAVDRGSTYFRYPKSQGPKVDAEKSGTLPVNPESLIAEMHERSATERKCMIVLGLKDDSGNIVETFATQENPLPELRDALTNAAISMFGCAIGLHMELVEGYGKRLEEMLAKKEGTIAEPS